MNIDILIDGEKTCIKNENHLQWLEDFIEQWHISALGFIPTKQRIKSDVDYIISLAKQELHENITGLECIEEGTGKYLFTLKRAAKRIAL